MEVTIRMIRDGLEKHQLPENCIDEVFHYVQCGRSPNNYLEAIIENDLISAVIFADEERKGKLISWVRFIKEVFPRDSYGTKSRYIVWTNSGGLKGRC